MINARPTTWPAVSPLSYVILRRHLHSCMLGNRWLNALADIWLCAAMMHRHERGDEVRDKMRYMAASMSTRTIVALWRIFDDMA